jgi:hypothetical protein
MTLQCDPPHLRDVCDGDLEEKSDPDRVYEREVGRRGQEVRED